MPADAYASVDQLKAEFPITDTADDTRLERVLDAVSRQIDRFCGFPLRHFWQTDSAAVRHYTADAKDHLWIHDATAVTALVTDEDGDGTFEITWASTDYLLWPYDASDEERPYTRIEVASTSGQRFPRGIRKGVKVTGRFGWTAVPHEVTEACLLQAARVHKRTAAPFGIAQAASLDGSGMRLLSRLDPDVELMLTPLKRPVIA